MSLDASGFKKDDSALTEKRVELIIYYVIDCYLLLSNDKPSYSKSKAGVQFEDYLRDKFVDDYLRANIKYYQNDIAQSPNIEISFTKESKEQYAGKEKSLDDYIDIYIIETALTKLLRGVKGEHFYFAIECKRVSETRDYNEYVKDVGKFASRPYESYRLPFEGQIAFIEDVSLTHNLVAREINERLKKNKTIITETYLINKVLRRSFEGSYISSHKRNHGAKAEFKIYHLMFDYSRMVVD